MRSTDSPLARLDPRRPPLRWLLRLPHLLYRARLGGLLGGRFLQITVRGRRTGRPHDVVLEVIGRDPETGDRVVASAWGTRSQWFRNVQADPEVRVRVRWRAFPGRLERLGEDVAAEVLGGYAREHPLAARWFIGPLLLGRRPATAGEFAALASSIPLLAVRPEAGSDRTARRPGGGVRWT